MAEIKSICVYCGSQSGNNSVFETAAIKTGKLMAQAGIELVYGGGGKGIMGAVSQAVLQHGGTVKGIIPGFLASHEGLFTHDTERYEITITDNMHERKRLMFEQSDAFLALPGGIGTLEEIVEIMTWAQLGRHEKPVGFLNIEGFWQPMFDLLQHMSGYGFLHTEDRIKPKIIDSPEAVVEQLCSA
ncbi:MAG: TIGR00730 family Rossman fold protein [Pseudomonadota bacterium]